MALAIFLLTYVFIAGSRLPFLKLDRPGGALAGALAMVLAGVVSPDEVFGRVSHRGGYAVDGDTLVLLFGMMLLAAYLTQAVFFRTVGFHAVRLAKSPRGLLIAVAFASAALSAFLVNDTVCLMLTPLVLAAAQTAELPPEPYLLALCMSSNAGSVATFTGNPQNMLLQAPSGLSYAEFAAYMTVPAFLSTGVVVGVLLFLYRHELPRRPIHVTAPPPPVDARLLALCGTVFLLVVAAFFAGLPMSWTALTGAVAVMVLSGRPPRLALERVDYLLLVFFASLFVVVFGVNKEGWADEVRQAFSPFMVGSRAQETFGFAGLTLVASNLFSNVPFVMLAQHWVPSLQDPPLGWQVLALASTLAGNLTLVGSVANLIVFELAREQSPIGFWRYLRAGIPVTLLSLALGLCTLLVEHAITG